MSAARDLLRERAAAVPGELRALSELRTPSLARDARARIARLRSVVTTGIGSSRAHAEFLAAVLAEDCGWPARFASTGAVAENALSGSHDDLLVVFSQGLSPNARHALTTPERWGCVVLVTAETGAHDDGKAEWLRRIEASGVLRVSMPGEGEFGTLVRVVGPVLGFGVALGLAGELAALRGRSEAAARVAFDGEAAASEFERLALRGEDEAPHPAAGWREHPVVFVGTGGGAEAASHLATRIAEGLYVPAPVVCDVLEFAHGPFQEIYERRATLFFLDDGRERNDDWLARLRAVLVPGRHELIVWSAARLRGRSAIFGFEARCVRLVEEEVERAELDPGEWPGKGRDAPLYDVVPAPPDATAANPSVPLRLAETTHPELVERMAAGARLAIVPLGSTEQHGAHLPFGTDTEIADAVALRLAERRSDAWVLPASPVGCAREHMDFEGTLSLGEATLEHWLADVLRSLAAHGFERALVFSAHGGNAAALEAMEARLRAVAEPMEVIVHSDLEGLAGAQHEASARAGVSAAEAGHHAGEGETSIMLGLAPGLVRSDDLAAGVLVEEGVDAQPLFYPSLRDRVPSGVVGDPSLASGERAEAYLSVWVAQLEALLDSSSAAGETGAAQEEEA